MKKETFSQKSGMRNIAAALLAALVMLAACTPKNKTVDYPLIGLANTEALDITLVERTDSATTLHMNAYHYPKQWILIASGSYLESGGQKYMLTGAEGIDPDKHFYMPDSGKAHFTLRFEPIPVNARTFDFIEGDGKGAFKLLDIDLTGKKDFDAPEGLPKEALSPEMPDSVPAPVLESGETTVRLHLLNYLPECGIEKMTIAVNTIFGMPEKHEVSIDRETGEASATFWQDGSALAVITVGNKSYGEAWLAPGETADLYVDIHAARHFFNKKFRSGTDSQAPIQRLYSTGVYAGLNHLLNKSDRAHYSMELNSGNFADWRMTSAQYADHVIERYKALADSIAQSGLSPVEKEYATISLRQEACCAMADGNYLREHNYRSGRGLWDFSVRVDSIRPMKAEDAQRITTLFDINDPKLLMGDGITDIAVIITVSKLDWMNRDSLPNGLMKDLRAVVLPVYKADRARLQPSELDALKAAGINPFFLQLLSRRQREAEEKTAELSGKMAATPDVPLDKLFEAIIAPHKGKVVLVDFWNTWCGPCRAAIKANEPLKQGELKSDDLVWIYIADETSPADTYMKMIPDIQGLHYRLNEKQWRQLVDKDFDIDGIPSYVVVDKQGKYSLRNDLRDHGLLKKTLKKALAE